MSSESFGPKMRWRRIRAGVSLEEISRRTNIGVDLWEAMELDDFSKWPTGIYARAPLREYANITGLDGDAVIDDFCRLFPEIGDRRRDGVLRGQAEIVGHRLQTPPQLPPGVLEDRRASSRQPAPASTEPAPRWRAAIDLRIAAAIVDQAIVLLVAATIGLPVGRFWMVLGLFALIYYGAGIAAAGCSFGSWAARTYGTKRPGAPQPDVFAALPRSVDHS
jgi:hypothetical protein